MENINLTPGTSEPSSISNGTLSDLWDRIVGEREISSTQLLNRELDTEQGGTAAVAELVENTVADPEPRDELDFRDLAALERELLRPLSAEATTSVPETVLSPELFEPEELPLNLDFPETRTIFPEALTQKVSGDLLAIAGDDTTPEWEAPILLTDDFVSVHAIAAAETEALVTDLQALGLHDISAHGRVVSGQLPRESVPQLATLASLQYARPVYQLITNVGSADNQGDIALNTDDARSNFGLDGDGFTIGFLSNSYNILTNSSDPNAIVESDDIASGDLPGLGNPLGNLTPVNVLRDLESTDPGFNNVLNSTAVDEGRAIAQLIHDIAPSAELAFRTAFLGAADFATGIGELVTAGADVIVDDVGSLAEPFFQDGVVAQAADAAAAAGVPYFSSAGNANRDSYESTFRPEGTITINSDLYFLHDFDPAAATTDFFQQLTLAPGEAIQLSFQWDEPFASAGGVGAGSDLDIFLLNEANDTILAGFARNNVGNDAFEILTFQNTTSAQANFNLIVGQNTASGGTIPNLIKYIDFVGDAADSLEFATNSSTSFGHPNAADTAGVGAAFFGFTPEFGTNPPVVESFSSTGGTPILFDTAGNRLATPEIRQQPRFTGPDGVNTTFFGNDIGFDADMLPNFFGTSASAPNVAAAAALLLEFAGGPGSLSPAEVYEIFENTAIDMDDPGTPGFDMGADFTTGFGFVNLEAAIDSITVSGTADRDTLMGTAGVDVITGRQGSDVITGNGGNDQFVYTNIRDAGDTITDFASGGDQIVLTELFDSLGISTTFADAIANGFLSFGTPASDPNDTVVLIDPDGSAGLGRAAALVRIEGVAAAALNQAANFII